MGEVVWMTNFEFMQAAEKKVAWCWAQLMQKDNLVLPSPRVTFDLRGTTAGTGGAKLIRLNLGFVPKDGETMISQTIPHECVHSWLSAKGDPSHVRSASQMQQYALNKMYGYRSRRPKRNPHGDTFMRYLSFLGGETKRTHNYSTEACNTYTQHRWAYKCPACGIVVNLTTCIHNKIMRGQVRFHRACGSVNGRLERVY
jgi:predicted SprT family Zn-dependent metalloprotease